MDPPFRCMRAPTLMAVVSCGASGRLGAVRLDWLLDCGAGEGAPPLAAEACPKATSTNRHCSAAIAKSCKAKRAIRVTPKNAAISTWPAGAGRRGRLHHEHLSSLRAGENDVVNILR